MLCHFICISRNFFIVLFIYYIKFDPFKYSSSPHVFIIYITQKETKSNTFLPEQIPNAAQTQHRHSTDTAQTQPRHSTDTALGILHQPLNGESVCCVLPGLHHVTTHQWNVLKLHSFCTKIWSALSMETETKGTWWVLNMSTVFRRE